MKLKKQSKSQNSAFRGYNNTNMRFIKLNPKAAAPYITIAIKGSITAGVFPENMKVAKILPIRKTGKDIFKKESHRPISKLHCLGKIYEEHIKLHLNRHFIENGIILKNHHGELKGKITATARAVIEHKIEDGYQNNKLIVAASFLLNTTSSTLSMTVTV